jgi:hypothetical protein
MNPHAYQVRELTRNEVMAALRGWLAQRHHLLVDALPD